MKLISNMFLKAAFLSAVLLPLAAQANVELFDHPKVGTCTIVADLGNGMVRVVPAIRLPDGSIGESKTMFRPVVRACDLVKVGERLENSPVDPDTSLAYSDFVVECFKRHLEKFNDPRLVGSLGLGIEGIVNYNAENLKMGLNGPSRLLQYCRAIAESTQQLEALSSTSPN